MDVPASDPKLAIVPKVGPAVPDWFSMPGWVSSCGR